MSSFSTATVSPFLGLDGKSEKLSTLYDQFNLMSSIILLKASSDKFSKKLSTLSFIFLVSPSIISQLSFSPFLAFLSNGFGVLFNFTLPLLICNNIYNQTLLFYFATA